MLTEYVRTGDVEVTFLQDKFERPAYAWHLLMMQVRLPTCLHAYVPKYVGAYVPNCLDI